MKNNQSTYGWDGAISQIIYFDRVLRTPERDAINYWLRKKYGNLPACTLPADTSGYIVTECQNAINAEHDGIIPASSCTVSCDTGFSATRGGGAYAVCGEKNGEFELFGCYPAYDNSTPVPSFVGTDAVAHWDAHDGIAVNGSNVTSWTSKAVRDGEQPVLTANGTVEYVIQSTAFEGRPSLSFSGSSYLENSAFAHLKSATKFTQLVVFKQDEGVSGAVSEPFLKVTQFILMALVFTQEFTHQRHMDQYLMGRVY